MQDLPKYYFFLDGKKSSDYNLQLQAPICFPKPNRKTETQSIPGRNGDLHITQNAFESVSTTADCFIVGNNADEQTSKAASWLLGNTKTRRLELPEDPECYRLVKVLSGFKTDVRVNLASVFSVTLTTNGERWFKSGEIPVDVPSTGITLINWYMPAKPLIICETAVTNDSEFTVNGYNVTVKKNSGTVIIDCDLQNAYSPTMDNMNKVVTLANNKFPVLDSGSNKITAPKYGKIKIVPRWWAL